MTIIMSNRVSTYLKLAIDAADTQIVIGDYDYQQIFSANSGDIYLIIRGPAAREIVKVDIAASLWGTYLKVARGQGGSTAQAWPQGSKIFASTTAELYNSFIQTEEYRQVYYNPNGVLNPLYKGEKVYQNSPAGCERWWKNFDGINPYWDIITGVPCDVETYKDIGWEYDLLIGDDWPPPDPDPPGAWDGGSRMDNGFWGAYEGYWDTDRWYSENANPYDIHLYVPGLVWQVGFRPTKIRFTHTDASNSATGTLKDDAGTPNTIATIDFSGQTSPAEFPITWASNDLDELYISRPSPAVQWAITLLEFFVPT